MKKLLTIILILSSFGLQAQSSLDHPTDAGGFGVKVSQPGITIDTLFVWKRDGDTIKRVLTNGEFIAQGAGVFANGSDMTARLQRAFNHPRIKTLVITYDTTARVKLSDTLTIPEGKTLKFGNGAKLYGGGYIAGPGTIANDDYTACFDSTIHLLNIKSATGHIPVTWWEDVDPTGTNNSIEGIKKAFAIDHDATIYFPKGTGYKTDDSLVLNPNLNLDMEAPIVPTDTTKAALIIGETGSSGTLAYRNKKYKFFVTSGSQSTWTDTNHVGVLFRNILFCELHPVIVSGFTKGIKFFGKDAGVAYNSMYGGRIEDNGEGISIAVSGGGWTNENNFYGTIIRVNSNVNTTKKRYGIKIGNSTYQCNSNKFWGPSFELGTRGTPVWVYGGSYNTVTNFRDEGNSDTTVLISKIGVQLSNRSNEFTASYGGVNIIDSSYNGLNKLTPAYFRTIDQTNYSPVVSVDNIVDRISYYDSDSTLNITAPAYFAQSVGTGAPVSTLKSTLLLKGDHLQVGTGAAVMTEDIDVSGSKKFVIKRSTITGFPGRVAISFFDTSGVNITSTKSIQSASATSYTTAYGGAHITGVDNGDDINIVLPTEAKRMRVYFVSGTAVLKLKSFKIIANGTGSVTTTSLAKTQSFNVAKEQPTIGSYRQGRVIYNDMSTDTDISHWICTSPGTFGTLTGITGSITTGTNILIVNDADNIDRGNILKIGSLNMEVLGKSGDTVYLYRNAETTLTGATIQYSAPTFKAVGASLSGGSAGSDLIKEYD